MLWRVQVLLVVILLGGSAAQIPYPSTEQNVTFAKACNHYVNRARFKERTGHVEFVTTMADSCEQAIVSLSSGGLTERRTAIVFLSRLLELRDTVIDMNMVRVFGETYTPYTRITYGTSGRTESVRKVSESGEYLIAHRMGLLAAFEAWLDSDPAMALASNGGS